MTETPTPSAPRDAEYKKLFKSFRLSNRKFGLREIFTEVFLNVRLFLVTLFSPIILSVLLSLLATETFVSEARLLVMVSREHMMQGPMGMMSMGGMGAETRIVRAEAEILGSHALLENTLRALGPDNIYPSVADLADTKGIEAALNKSVPMMKEDLSTRFLPNTNIIALTYRHRDPEMAALLLNTMIGIYLEQRREVFADVGIDVLAEELKHFENVLADHDKQMEALRQEAGVTDFATERKALLSRLTTLELDQVRANVDLTGLYAQEQELSLLKGLIPEEVSIFSQNAGVSALNQALDNLRRLEMEHADLEDRYEEGSRFIEESARKVAQAQQSVDKLRKMDVDQKRKGRNDIYDEVQQDIINTQADQRELEAETTAREFAIEETKDRLEQLNVLETQYNQLKRQRLILEANYKTYAMQHEQERLKKAIESNFDDSTIRVIEHANPPVEGESKRKAIIILGILSGLFLAATSLYLSRISRNVMVSPEEAEETLELPVLMTINDKSHLLQKGGS